MNTNEPTTRTITRAAARVEVAKLLGWRDISAGIEGYWEGTFQTQGDHFRGIIPDCFVPGNAMHLLFQLPEEWDWARGLNRALCLWKSSETLPYWAWGAASPNQLAVAAVAAYLTAHEAGEKVIIED